MYTLYHIVSTHCTKCSVYTVKNAKYALYPLLIKHSTKFSVHTLQNSKYTQYQILRITVPNAKYTL